MQLRLIPAVWLACMAVPLTAQQQAGSAADFIDSVGVDTHFSYTDSAYYQHPGTIIADIQKLGVRHVRDGFAYGWTAPNFYNIYTQLSQAGIHPDLVMPNPGPNAPSAKAIEQLLTNYPSVDTIEAPNEFDQANDPNWPSDLRNYLPTLMKVSKDTGIPLIGPSLTQTGSYALLGNVAAQMTVNNLHAYWGGRNPETTGWGGPDAQGNYYGSLQFDFDQLSITGPNVPVMMTETGYVVNNTTSQNVITEATEAVYEPRLLLHAWNMGIKRTYIYELTEEPSSTAGFGLLRSDLSPRPAFTAVANLMQLLSDSGGSFAAGSLSYTLSGNSSGVETTLLEKKDGSFWLALWVPQPIFEVNLLHLLNVASQQVSISVPGKTVTNVWSFNNAGNTSTWSPNQSSATIQVGPTVTLLRID